VVLLTNSNSGVCGYASFRFKKCRGVARAHDSTRLDRRCRPGRGCRCSGASGPFLGACVVTMAMVFVPCTQCSLSLSRLSGVSCVTNGPRHRLLLILQLCAPAIGILPYSFPRFFLYSRFGKFHATICRFFMSSYCARR
jgi:hypothetical protein